MAKTLEQLLAAESQDQIKARLLAALNKVGFPYTDWSSGAGERTTVESFALAYRDLVGNLIPQIAGGGFLDEAEGDWLTLHAKQRYDLDRTAATYTTQRITLACGSGNGPYTIAAGQLVFQSTAGRRYRNTTGGTLNTSDTLEVEADSESPNDSSNPLTNYVDSAETILTMVTPLPGVTCSNPKPSFTPVTHAGNGTGTMTPSLTTVGVEPSSHTFKIRITKSGQVGAGLVTYEMDFDGVEVSLGGTIPASFDLPGGTTIAFANGAVNPSFFNGDIYEFSTPGSPIITQGRDEESDEALRIRCRARWPSLADIPTNDKFELWAKLADQQVTKVKVRASETVAGLAGLTIAGQVNPLGGAVVTAVQEYIDERTGVLDRCEVSAAAAVDIDIDTGGKVTVPIGQTAAVKAALDALWSSYIADLPLGGIVRISKLMQFIEEAGATDFQDIAFDAPNVEAPPEDSSSSVNIQLADDEVAAVADPPSVALTFYEA